jgi:hypothetical protein
VRDPTAQRARDLVRRPHLWQEVRRSELRQDLRIDLVGLDLRAGDPRVRIELDTVTRPTCSANSSAIAHVIAVDANTT